MNKKIWKRICIGSVILLLLSVGTIIGMYAKAMLSIPNEPQVSIIGGADYPTVCFCSQCRVVSFSPFFISFQHWNLGTPCMYRFSDCIYIY